MCDSWRMKPGAEMTPAQAGQAFAKIGKLDIVRLTGGEPFLRDDFLELAREVVSASSPSVLHVTTNGSRPEQVESFVRAFEKSGRLRFMVSLDGLAEEHDANRGQEVAFAVAEDTIHRLVRMRAATGIEVSVNHTVISSASLDQHAELARRFAPWGVDVHAVLAYADFAMYGLKRFGKAAPDLIKGGGYPLHPALAEAEVIRFARGQLQGLSRLRDPALRWAKRYYWRGLLARLRGDSRPLPKPPCVALRSHIRLLPDGGVPVCQFNTDRVGNLLSQSFDEVWHGPTVQAPRAWVDACNGCWAECEVMPNALYTGDLFFSGWH